MTSGDEVAGVPGNEVYEAEILWACAADRVTCTESVLRPWRLNESEASALRAAHNGTLTLG